MNHVCISLVKHCCVNIATELRYARPMPGTDFQRARSIEAKQQRVDAILEAARDLGIERGIRQVTLTDIGDRVGLHKSAMLRYFDAAEHEFLRSIGLKYQDLQAVGVALPRVHVEGTYTGAVYFDDMVSVQVRVERVGTSSFTLAFSASIGERPVANGRITIVALDLATQKARPLPADWVSKLQGHAPE